MTRSRRARSFDALLSWVPSMRCGTTFGHEIRDAKKTSNVNANDESESAIKNVLLYGSWFRVNFLKFVFAITFSFLFCSLSNHWEKWSAKNFESNGIKLVEVWIEIKKFVFRRSAVWEFFLPLRDFADTSYCADLLVSVKLRCWQNIEKSVCRAFGHQTWIESDSRSYTRNMSNSNKTHLTPSFTSSLLHSPPLTPCEKPSHRRHWTVGREQILRRRHGRLAARPTTASGTL